MKRFSGTHTSYGAGATLGRLMTIAEASQIIREGQIVSVAGDERALRQLPTGLWIGGTISYFMAEGGGKCSQDIVFVNFLPDAGEKPRLAVYDIRTIEEICNDAPASGFTVMVIPGYSQILDRYARDAPEFENIYLQPLVGWVSGVHLDELWSRTPKVVYGPTGEFLENSAVALHVGVDEDRITTVETVNIFEPGNGDILRFPESGFAARQVEVNGQLLDFTSYLNNNRINIQLPLMTEYRGAALNVGIQSVEAERVTFFAPVFEGQEYRFARDIPSYSEAFEQCIPKETGQVAFCCNCILNYQYGELEGKSTGQMYGPISFGEIAYQLVTQTMVYLRIL